jgi:hypothetical protein
MEDGKTLAEDEKNVGARSFPRASASYEGIDMNRVRIVTGMARTRTSHVVFTVARIEDIDP